MTQAIQIHDGRPFLSRIAPGFALMLLAPLLAEALPGATRPSVYLGFPLIFAFEVAVWGGGALFARFLTRRFQLGWISLVLLALVISIAEEFIIQQTSIAPMVLKLKGVEYARAFGVNYVYLVWALIYEAVFVVLLPVMLAELIFPTRRESSWGSTWGLVVAGVLFPLGALGAWFGWTQIARPNVFHLPPYNPPAALIFTALGAIALLIFVAIGPFRRALSQPAKAVSPPAPLVLGVLGFVFAVLLEGLVVLAFGAAPQIPPALPLGLTFAVIAAAFSLLPGWSAHPNWGNAHRYALVLGAVIGNMAAGYVGYIWSTTPIDFWGKTIIDLIAFALLIVLGFSRAKPAAIPA